MRWGTPRYAGLATACGVLAVFGGSALAATGDLTAAGGCIEDSQVGPGHCPSSTKGLNLPVAVAASADGNSVYATASGGNAISRFDRDPATGELTPHGCVGAANANSESCGATADGLRGASAVAISPDGTSVYVAGRLDSAIVVFSRDPATGKLRSKGCIKDTFATTTNCAATGPGLGAVQDLAVSPDGTSLYAISGADDIVTFKRSLASGKLTPKGCIKDDDGGPGACSTSAPGLRDPDALAVSPDGTSVYVAATSDDAVSHFSRSANGTLRFRNCVADNDTGSDPCTKTTDGLDAPESVAVSPDNASVYVVSFFDDALVRFDRDSSSGNLSPKGCFQDLITGTDACAKTARGLTGSRSVVVSDDGASVYVGSDNADAISIFNRSTTGALKANDCLGDAVNSAGCTHTAEGLSGVQALALAGNGSLYSVSSGDEAIAAFSREPAP